MNAWVSRTMPVGTGTRVRGQVINTIGIPLSPTMRRSCARSAIRDGCPRPRGRLHAPCHFAVGDQGLSQRSLYNVADLLHLGAPRARSDQPTISFVWKGGDMTGTPRQDPIRDVRGG